MNETDSADKFLVFGRGVLHLSVLIETMRREGYELQIGQPQVIIKELMVSNVSLLKADHRFTGRSFWKGS